MTPELREFAARLRDYISVYASEFGFTSSASDPALTAHNDAEFNAMTLVLFALQFEANPNYRTICQAKGITPEKVSNWTQIPAVPTSAFKELDLTCLLPEERTAVFHSSGTTGQIPSRHFHCADSLSVYEASLWHWFRAHLFGGEGVAQASRLSDSRMGVESPAGETPAPHAEQRSGMGAGKPAPDSTLAILTPPPDQAPNSSLVHMFEVVRRHFDAPESAYFANTDKDGAWNLAADRICETLAQATASSSSLLLLGTAFSFVHLVDLLRERNLRFVLPAGSRVMETGGYKGRSRELPRRELHALISHQLGLSPSQIVCEYGMSELSSQAYDRFVTDEGGQAGNRIFRFPPWARARVISLESGGEAAEGATGLLRIIDLANVFSVMALQTEDLAICRSDGFELVGRAEPAEPRGCSLMNADLEAATNTRSRS